MENSLDLQFVWSFAFAVVSVQTAGAIEIPLHSSRLR
jgi:hypothetical protein